MKKITKLIIVVIFLLPISTVSAFEWPSTEEGFLQWLKDTFGEVEFRKDVEPVANFIKGKILDQNGQPVDGVEVTAGWMYMHLPSMTRKVKRKTVVTDEQGIFFFQSTTEDTPSIEKIIKKGYEYNRKEPFYQLPYYEQDQLLLDSKENPIEFYLRKLGPTTYVYSYGGSQHRFTKAYEFVVHDIFSPNLEEVNPDLSQFKFLAYYDLAIEVVKNGSSFTLRFLPLLESTGLQLLDSLLYIAPSNGYGREASLAINNGEEVTKYLYFTSRDPFVYSRMEIRVDANEERLRFFFKTWTNPYGSRNLELEPDLPVDLFLKLRDEAEEALQDGRLATEPDIPALIATGQYE